MPERDELDKLIDSALESYAEPRHGLEQRMLARISDAAAKLSSRRLRLLLAIAIPLTASLLFLAYWIPKISHPQRVQIAAVPPVSSPAHAAVMTKKIPSTQPVAHMHKRYVDTVLRRAQLNVIQRPKLNIFPAPQSLSDAERAMTRFASEASEADRKALVAPQPDLAEPIQITAIHIPPLQLSEVNQH